MPSISATTAAVIAAVSTVVSAGTAAYSSYAAGEAKEEAAEYNAEIAKQKSQEALQRGASEAAEKRDRARRLASTQVEGAAMSGVEVSSGTALDLLTETAGMGELDALRSVTNAQREAWGYQAQSELDLFEGRAASRAGKLNAAGTLLGAAGNVTYSSYGKGGFATK